MSDRSTEHGWGPAAPADPNGNKWAQRKLLLWGVIALALLGIANGATRGESPATIVCGFVSLLVMAWSALPAACSGGRVRNFGRTVRGAGR